MKYMVFRTIRNKIIGAIYILFIKPICFAHDAERVHNLFIRTGKILGCSKLGKQITLEIFSSPRNPEIQQNILGISFPNPVGLSAGFDKNAELIEILPNVGFGFAEVGSITAQPCRGNTGSRLERIPQKRSIWVNLGLNNFGANEIFSRLQSQFKKQKPSIPIGISIAKTNCKETVDTKKGIRDYVISLKLALEKEVGDYFVLNISCPNAFGGQPFTTPYRYAQLMKEISKIRIKKPIFIKLSPDIPKKNIDKIISISRKYNVVGFVCTNLTKNHTRGTGGLSGKAVEASANSLLVHVYKKASKKFICIGVGGIFSAEDAYKKIKLGASLVQLITGMIYQGPQLISEINEGLIHLLKRDGYTHISQAVGADTDN